VKVFRKQLLDDLNKTLVADNINNSWQKFLHPSQMHNGKKEIIKCVFRSHTHALKREIFLNLGQPTTKYFSFNLELSNTYFYLPH
jgi:hypothetical protein